MTGVIDVHAHAIPLALQKHVERRGRKLGIAVLRGDHGVRWVFPSGHRTAPVEPLLLDAAARIERLDESGVTTQILSSFIDVGAHHLSGPVAREYARIFNDELATVTAAQPDRLLGLATLPFQEPTAAAGELQRAVDELGFVGAEISATCAMNGRSEPFWEAADALSAMILIHPEASTSSNLPYFLGNLVGNPGESTLAAASLIMSGTLERYPNVNPVLVHGGGFLPYQLGRLQHGFEAYADRFGATVTADPRRSLRRFHFDTVLHDAAAIEFLIATVGADRVVVGTDDPFAMGDRRPLATLGGVDLDEGQRQLVLHDNAVRLLAAVRTPDGGDAVRSGPADP